MAVIGHNETQMVCIRETLQITRTTTITKTRACTVISRMMIEVSRHISHLNTTRPPMDQVPTINTITNLMIAMESKRSLIISNSQRRKRSTAIIRKMQRN